MSDDDLGLQQERTALARRRTWWLAHAGVALLALRSLADAPPALASAALALLVGAVVGWRGRRGMGPATATVVAVSLVAVVT